MALHGDKTLAELQKKHICHIGNTVYNITPLLTPQNNVRRDAYLENVREKMVLVQICPTCNDGPCDPDSHKFQESEYRLPDESQNFTAAMASLLSQSGISPAFTSGGTNFLTGGESTDFETLPDTDQTRRDILAVANRFVNGSNVNNGPAAEIGRQTDGNIQNEVPPGTLNQQQQPPAQPTSNAPSSGLEKVFSEFLALQKSRDDMMMELIRKQVPANSPADPPAGKVVIAELPNPDNANYLGMTLPTMYTLQGDPKTCDMSKIKSKIKSGEFHSGTHEIIHYEPWPSHCLNKMFCPEAPINAKLSPIQYFSGSLNKILAEHDKSQRNSVTENQLKFLANIANTALVHRWEDILELSAGLYRMLERKQITWDQTAALQTWWDRSLANLKAKSSTYQHGGGGRPNSGGKPDKVDKNTQKLVAGLPVNWMQENSICIKFQTGKCTEPGPHTTPKGSKMLKHACAGCMKIGKPEDSTHGANECPNKEQFFQ